MRQPTGGYRAGPASGRGAVAQQRAQKGADDLPLPYAVEAAGALCNEIKWNLEYIRNFFQNCGCTLSPSAFQIGNVTLSEVSLGRDIELRLTAPFAN